MDMPLLHLRRVQACPVFELPFFLPGWRVPYQGSPFGTVLFRPTQLALRQKNLDWLGLWMRLVILAKSTAVLSETFIAILQDRSQCSSLSRLVSR
jgi:hypothetical protein